MEVSHAEILEQSVLRHSFRFSPQVITSHTSFRIAFRARVVWGNRFELMGSTCSGFWACLEIRKRSWWNMSTTRRGLNNWSNSITHWKQGTKHSPSHQRFRDGSAKIVMHLYWFHGKEQGHQCVPWRFSITYLDHRDQIQNGGILSIGCCSGFSKRNMNVHLLSFRCQMDKLYCSIDFLRAKSCSSSALD